MATQTTKADLWFAGSIFVGLPVAAAVAFLMLIIVNALREIIGAFVSTMTIAIIVVGSAAALAGCVFIAFAIMAFIKRYREASATRRDAKAAAQITAAQTSPAALLEWAQAIDVAPAVRTDLIYQLHRFDTAVDDYLAEVDHFSTHFTWSDKHSDRVNLRKQVRRLHRRGKTLIAAGPSLPVALQADYPHTASTIEHRLTGQPRLLPPTQLPAFLQISMGSGLSNKPMLALKSPKPESADAETIIEPIPEPSASAPSPKSKESIMATLSDMLVRLEQLDTLLDHATLNPLSTPVPADDLPANIEMLMGELKVLTAPDGKDWQALETLAATVDDLFKHHERTSPATAAPTSATTRRFQDVGALIDFTKARLTKLAKEHSTGELDADTFDLLRGQLSEALKDQLAAMAGTEAAA